VPQRGVPIWRLGDGLRVELLADVLIDTNLANVLKVTWTWTESPPVEGVRSALSGAMLRTFSILMAREPYPWVSSGQYECLPARLL